MNTPTDPKGSIRGENVMTTIQVLDNAGNPWAVNLEHNGNTYAIPKKGLNIHINGGSVRVHGIDITKQVQKGVENIFRYNTWKGDLKKIEPTGSSNTHLPHPELSPES